MANPELRNVRSGIEDETLVSTFTVAVGGSGTLESVDMVVSETGASSVTVEQGPFDVSDGDTVDFRLEAPLSDIPGSTNGTVFVTVAVQSGSGEVDQRQFDVNLDTGELSNAEGVKSLSNFNLATAALLVGGAGVGFVALRRLRG
jgi:hypothetical protein